MVPPDIYEGCPSPGERELFGILKGSSLTHDWTVIHSLEIAKHIRRSSGEADFICLVPGEGILCLEVKACRQLRRDHNGWWYGNADRPDHRGPFKQASEAMYSIRKTLLARFPGFKSLVFGSAVVFPYIPFDMESTEWHSWQALDERVFSSPDLPNHFIKVLRKTRERFDQVGLPSGNDSRSPSKEEITTIVNALRPNFEFLASPKARLEQVETELKRYTEEQFQALDSMEENSRILFSGPAGTGKTLLAIEAARRASGKGKRTLFLCFNRHLGNWLIDQFGTGHPNVEIGSAHRWLKNHCSIGEVPQDAGSDYWKAEFPSLVLDRLLASDSGTERFDTLVLDEAQDFNSDIFFDIFDLILKKGMKNGEWRIFGDFEKQVIYQSYRTLKHHLQEAVPSFSQFTLRVNCRNSPRIAALAGLLGRLSPGYTKVLRLDNGIEPELKFYNDEQEQKAALISSLERLYRLGIRGRNVVILSPSGDRNSIAGKITENPWKDRIRPVSSAAEGHVRFSSIHAFKGLESHAVILTDLENLPPPDSSDIVYVGITRSVEHLVLLFHKSSQAEIYHYLTSPQAGQTGAPDACLH